MFRSLILVAALCAALSFGGVAAEAEGDDSSVLMAAAAHQFVLSLSAEQRALGVFPFEQEVFESWHFIPMRNRTGLPFDKMDADSIRLADALVSSGVSRAGYHKTKSIMSLEQVLFEYESNGRTNPFTELRKPNSYYFAIYGEPGLTGVWGWRVEGHHISLHFAMKDGKVVTSTPMFFGANPHLSLEGPRKGLRVLGREEDLGRALLNSLDAKQRKAAIVSDEAPNDVLTSNRSAVAWDSVPKEGLRRSEMSDAQKGLLQGLLNEYVYNVPRDLAQQRLDAIAASGDEVYFVWHGSTGTGVGNPHYYRVHGKAFLVEYDNVQNNANHSHTVWRDYENDFGRDLLAEHYRASH